MAFRIRHHRGTSFGSSTASATVFSRIVATLFFFVFFAMGTGFCVFICVEFYRNLSTYTWRAAEATITHSEIVRDGDGGQRLELRYEYLVGDRRYSSERYNSPSDRGYSHAEYSELERIRARYPVGAATTARVDPSDPSRAILVHPSLWIGLAVFFPLIFVVIGGGGIYFTWFGARFGKAVAVQSIAGRSQTKHVSGRWILRILGAVFAVVGLLVVHLMLILPLVRVARAKSWVSVPATVIASRVVVHRGDDSTTYRVDILYEYEVGGRVLRSNRYDFTTGSSSGRGAKQAIVDAHPPGKEIAVYVNPSDPFDAVVHRGYPQSLWVGLVGLVFFVSGVALLIGSYYMRDKTGAGKGQGWQPTVATGERADDPFALPSRTARGRVTLRRTVSPFGKLALVILFALCWNGITAVFVGIAIHSHLMGNPEWLLTFFVIPFVLVGIVTLAMIPYFLLALFNPAAVLEVSSAAPALGDTLAIDWSLEGRADRVSTFTLSLVGEEQATYQRGTNTVTDKFPFYKQDLLSTSDAGQILTGGHLDALIPSDVMHSFDAKHNKIVWTLNVHGDIKLWPDINEQFQLVIRPKDPEEIARD